MRMAGIIGNEASRFCTPLDWEWESDSTIVLVRDAYLVAFISLHSSSSLSAHPQDFAFRRIMDELVASLVLTFNSAHLSDESRTFRKLIKLKGTHVWL